MFQFHSGSIQTEPEIFWLDENKVFQFHSGSIQTDRTSPASLYVPRFNSTLVRFKQNLAASQNK